MIHYIYTFIFYETRRESRDERREMREIDWMVYEYSWARIVERDELSRRGRITFKSDYAVSMRRVISHFIDY
jgi:hypothetical protein